jgi:hypothetical protein
MKIKNADVGFLDGSKYVLLDRDSKFCTSFRDHERNHQGLDNVIPFPDKEQDEGKSDSGTVHGRDRLGFAQIRLP